MYYRISEKHARYGNRLIVIILFNSTFIIHLQLLKVSAFSCVPSGVYGGSIPIRHCKVAVWRRLLRGGGGGRSVWSVKLQICANRNITNRLKILFVET